jgi:hypothetical protein
MRRVWISVVKTVAVTEDFRSLWQILRYCCYWRLSLLLTLADVRTVESRPYLICDQASKNIPFKNTSGWIYVVFCACDKMPLFSAVFCVDRAGYKFDFKICKNETPKNGDQCVFKKNTTSFSNRVMLLTGYQWNPPSVFVSLKGHCRGCEGQWHSSLEKGSLQQLGHVRSLP